VGRRVNHAKETLVRLYHTTSRNVASGRDLPLCRSQVCRFSGFTHDHICFATEPQPGNGEWVYEIEVPVEKIFRFEFRYLFRRGMARRYAIPYRLVAETPVRKFRFKDTGGSWNTFRVVLRDAERNNLWGLIWMSRPGVATARVIEQRTQPEYMLVEVKLTPLFDLESDYLIAERHETITTEWGHSKEK